MEGLWFGITRGDFFPIRSHTGTDYQRQAIGTAYWVTIITFLNESHYRTISVLVPSTLTSCTDTYRAHTLQEAVGSAVAAVALRPNTDTAVVTVEEPQNYELQVEENGQQAVILTNYKIRQGSKTASEKFFLYPNRGVLLVWKSKTWTDPVQSWTEHFYLYKEGVTFVTEHLGEWIEKMARPFNGLHYVSPDFLRMPEYIVDELKAGGISQSERWKLEEVLAETDVLYVTRIQKERFTDLKLYEEAANVYRITPQTLEHSKTKPGMIVMHPLPRVNEIDAAVDSDPRAAYFRQMRYGLFVRMALIALVLGKA